MKKLIYFILFLTISLAVGIHFATASINEVITKEDLPQTVYQDDSSFESAHNALLDFFNINSDQDYSNIELFMNYMIYDSIKENMNDEYDPLSDCETEACMYILATDYVTVDYMFARLNEDDQIVLTVSAKRFNYPTVETAVHLIFDVTINELQASFTLTLNHARLADRTISRELLDRIMTYVDKEAIEDSVTYGELDLDTYSFTVSLLDIN